MDQNRTVDPVATPGGTIASGKVSRRRFLATSVLALAGLGGASALLSACSQPAAAPQPTAAPKSAAPAAAAPTAAAAPAAAAKPAGQVLELKFAEVQAVGGIYDRWEHVWAKEVADRTNGQVKINLFPGGALGGETDVLQGMKTGSIQMSLSGLTNMPFLDALWGPYVFKDNAHAHRVLDGDIGKAWQDRVLKESGGLRLINFVYFGPRELNTRNTPGKTPSELKGLKIRVMEGPIYLATWKALGASPVPMAWPEVYTALQQGTIDAQENPFELIVSSKLYEVTKYVALTSHVRPFRFMFMSDAAYNKMTADQQKILTDTWVETCKKLEDEYISSDQKYIDTLKSKGMTIVEADVAAYKAATESVRQEFVAKVWGQDVYNKVEAM